MWKWNGVECNKDTELYFDYCVCIAYPTATDNNGALMTRKTCCWACLVCVTSIHRSFKIGQGKHIKNTTDKWEPGLELTGDRTQKNQQTKALTINAELEESQQATQKLGHCYNTKWNKPKTSKNFTHWPTVRHCVSVVCASEPVCVCVLGAVLWESTVCWMTGLFLLNCVPIGLAWDWSAEKVNMSQICLQKYDLCDFRSVQNNIGIMLVVCR